MSGDVAYVQTVTDDDPGGVFDIHHVQLHRRAGIGPNLYSGTVAELPEIPDQGTVEVDLVFLSVTPLDPLRPRPRARSGMVSSAGLTVGSPMPLYPPVPVADIVADPATAGDWTVTLTGYRTGFLQSTTSPSPGRLELEVFATVTLGPAATGASSGLSFSPAAQLFLATPDGYMIAAATAGRWRSCRARPRTCRSPSRCPTPSSRPRSARVRSISEIVARAALVETTFPASLGGADELPTDGGGI